MSSTRSSYLHFVNMEKVKIISIPCALLHGTKYSKDEPHSEDE